VIRMIRFCYFISQLLSKRKKLQSQKEIDWNLIRFTGQSELSEPKYCSKITAMIHNSVIFEIKFRTDRTTFINDTFIMYIYIIL